MNQIVIVFSEILTFLKTAVHSNCSKSKNGPVGGWPVFLGQNILLRSACKNCKFCKNLLTLQVNGALHDYLVADDSSDEEPPAAAPAAVPPAAELLGAFSSHAECM